MIALQNRCIALLLLLGAACGQPAEATRENPASITVPAGFTDTVIANGVTSPTAFEILPDGRIFVAEQGGNLRVVSNGSVLSTPFLSLSVDSAGERGLLGVTVDPNFTSNNFVYVYYTSTTPSAHNRLSRFTANGNIALAGSEVVLMDLDNLSTATNHNGGALHFGPDGRLYIAVGENARSSNAQTLSNRLGKILRLNSDGTIPSDNPFFSTASGLNRSIWAMGLRNPFTFAFQPGTGRMFIDDVGEATWEEINDGIAGSNYGWPTTEGPTTDPRFRSPVFSYGHGMSSSTGCAIIGGAFYNPQTVQFPASFVGKYFFADLCGGWIRTIDPANNFTAEAFASVSAQPVDMRVTTEGSLLVLERVSGSLHRISASSGQAPQIVTHPASMTVPVGGTASFSCSASGSAPLAYQWQRNGAPINGATAPTYSLANVTLSDNGATFRCVASNSAGSATSNAATLTVTSNRAPSATISLPQMGAHYVAGQTYTYQGSATDPEDGNLPASAFTWWIEFHHDTHTHPFVPETSGSTSGSFTIPTRGEVSSNVWYRIHLRVVDSGGLTFETTRDILPQTVTMTFSTQPAGLQVTIDGQPMTTPVSITGVVGIIRSLGVVSPQTVGGSSYTFQSWSDGGMATHEISTPATNTNYVATYQASMANVGLRGSYYDQQNFTMLQATRTDPTIDFSWGTGGPPGVQPDTFSVVWTGFITPPSTAAYTFYLNSDEAARIAIGGTPVVSDFLPHTLRERSGMIMLNGGQRYTVRIEYYENTGNAAIQWSWSSASIPKAIVPSSVLSW